MLSFTTFLNEGVNDPGIFKAIILAGGPGAGKSFVIKKTALKSMGLKLIASDEAFERRLEKAGLEKNPENISSEQGKKLRSDAKKFTGKVRDIYISGRLGLIIDGTGKTYETVKKQKDLLTKAGYDTLLLFVNTDLDTAIKRNKERSRSLPDDYVKKFWNQVQNNIGKLQKLFGNKNFLVVDNSEDSNINKESIKIYNQLSRWIKKPPKNPIARKWIKDQKNRN